MRPERLNPLFAETTSLTGIGPRLGALYEQLCGSHVVDLLWHLPISIVDRRHQPTIAAAEPGRVATFLVTVGAHAKPHARNARQPYKVTTFDETGELELVFFHAVPDYLEKTLPQGSQVAISGTPERYDKALQMTHPDFIVPADRIDEIAIVQPVYPLTAGLSQRQVAKAVAAALDKAPDLAEWLDPALLERERWPTWRVALNAAHAPRSAVSLEGDDPARARLAYDELMASQLAVALLRAHRQRRKGEPIAGNGALRAKVLAALPFRLTDSQERAARDIADDMASENRMLRLLQGDVGSGKTVVALMGMLNAVEAGAQAALMAPTEILAQQHFETIAPLAEAAGVEIVLITGRDKTKRRKLALDGLASGKIALAVGTHALFQQEVVFGRLAFVVIDEQHRFGVHQRMTLGSKGRAADMLVMTATPIPRTLTLAAYGDMDESRLTEKPAGRLPIDTATIDLARLDEVYGAVGRALDKGGKVYWVCPLVEESESVDLAAATDRAQSLKSHFGDRVALVHGQMKGKEKDAAMARFAAPPGATPEGGPADLLVATTVIEVGVDVPDATVMVVEHAERFGLAQLHQLRGRVGRSDKKSTCLLLYDTPITQTARARLNILRETEDGFRIAEEDLKLRGGGEILGTRQSGLPVFRLADLACHADLLAMARDDARLVLEKDPDLETGRGQALRILLYLFQRDEAAKYLKSG
ncbi:MAG: ATP-dependent DNA helicase RecG [Alphaproteobacteria bacterium]|nr:ATP-dependent DNA helicase RecG [Alphaproteobacteria bacterium]